MATILDVIDNFFSIQDDKNLLSMSGRAIFEFGEEVRKFAAHHHPPSVEKKMHPVYLGGWPSANFWHAAEGQLLLSSLLYCGHVLVKDPLADWFSLEQYRQAQYYAARPGFLNKDLQPSIARTRQFLSVVVPSLQALKPLIQRGIVILVPSRQFKYKNQSDIDNLSSSLFEAIGSAPLDFTREFSPMELAWEDNVRGQFAFRGGDREAQISECIKRSLDYFSTEYLMALEYGFDYAAPFRYEQHLCENGLGKAVFASPGDRILNSVLRSPLPLYKGLTPDLVADLREDESFADFRSQLYVLYRDIPRTDNNEELVRYISEAEEALLSPVLRKVEKEMEGNVVVRTGATIAKKAMKVAASVLISNASGGLGSLAEGALHGGAKEAASSIVDRLTGRNKEGGPITLWKKLYGHSRKPQDEISWLDPPSPNEYWNIPENNSLKVTISSRIFLNDFMPRFCIPDTQSPFCSDDVYAECPCGSKRKFKFCCYGLERWRFPP